MLTRFCVRLLLSIFGQCGDGMTNENISLVFWPSELHSVLNLYMEVGLGKSYLRELEFYQDIYSLASATILHANVKP